MFDSFAKMKVGEFPLMMSDFRGGRGSKMTNKIGHHLWMFPCAKCERYKQHKENLVTHKQDTVIIMPLQICS